jgi:hypothetical protein
MYCHPFYNFSSKFKYFNDSHAQFIAQLQYICLTFKFLLKFQTIYISKIFEISKKQKFSNLKNIPISNIKTFKVSKISNFESLRISNYIKFYKFESFKKNSKVQKLQKLSNLIENFEVVEKYLQFINKIY